MCELATFDENRRAVGMNTKKKMSRSPRWVNYFIRAKRVSNCYIPPKKSVICACVVCSTNLGFSVEKKCTYVPGISRLPRYVYDTRYYVLCTRYIRMYVPGISRLPRCVYDTRYVLCTRYECTWYQPADERSARGRTRLTTVTCISCRSL